MNIAEPRMAIAGGLFVLTLATGVLVWITGKPYRTGLFNVHKLIALAAVVLAIMAVVRLRTMVSFTPLTVAALAITALCALCLFASGALLSIGKPDHIAILAVHRVAPVLATAAIGVASIQILQAAAI